MLTGWIAFSIAGVALIALAVRNQVLAAGNSDLLNAVRDSGERAADSSLEASRARQENHTLIVQNAALRAKLIRSDNCNLVLQSKDAIRKHFVEDLIAEHAEQKAKIERLLDNVTQLAAESPKRGSNGRFVKKG